MMEHLARITASEMAGVAWRSLIGSRHRSRRERRRIVYDRPPNGEAAVVLPGARSGEPLASSRVFQKPDLLNRINLICPVQSRSQKYSVSPRPQINFRISDVHPTEGRIMIVTFAGMDAVDAAALARKGIAGWASARERSTGAQTNDAEADGEVVWS
jgi:hypothetical protein